MCRAGCPARIAVILSLILFVSVFPLATRSSAGQVGTGSIIGQVTDESGAILPGVTVTASSPALQFQYMASITDGRGEYRLTPLPIGTYTVESRPLCENDLTQQSLVFFLIGGAMMVRPPLHMTRRQLLQSAGGTVAATAVPPQARPRPEMLSGSNSF